MTDMDIVLRLIVWVAMSISGLLIATIGASIMVYGWRWMDRDFVASPNYVTWLNDTLEEKTARKAWEKDEQVTRKIYEDGV